MIIYIVFVIVLSTVSISAIIYFGAKADKFEKMLTDRTVYYEQALGEKNALLIERNNIIQHLMYENDSLKRKCSKLYVKKVKIKEYDNS